VVKIMANAEHLAILLQGVEPWNAWYLKNRQVKPDLSKADLREKDLAGVNFRGVNLRNADFHQANLSGANLRGANLCDANLFKTNLCEADLRGANLKRVNLHGAALQKALVSGANLTRANLSYTDFSQADLSNSKLNGAELSGGANLCKAKLSFAILANANLLGANLSEASLVGADLYEAELTRASFVGADLGLANLSETDLQDADFSNANLADADLSQASLVRTNLEKANLTGCRVYGCSVWDLKGEPASQKDLRISRHDDGDITTDQIEVAQFIYLMYDNKKIRTLINSVTSKGVLILGRFSDPARKVVLDGLRDKLREFNLLPIVFDFERPTDKDYTETVQTLAGLSLFVIADVTNPKSAPLELEATAKQFKIPCLPILDTSADKTPFAMLVDLQKSYHWVLPTLAYDSKDRLLDNVKVAIIDRALAKHNELREQKARESQMLTIDDLLRT
jgi:uncharacterized protein YjbI with pentapeptide repeats